MARSPGVEVGIGRSPRFEAELECPIGTRMGESVPTDEIDGRGVGQRRLAVDHRDNRGQCRRAVLRQQTAHISRAGCYRVPETIGWVHGLLPAP